MVSFLASQLVGEKGEVIAFEPLPEAFKFLRSKCKTLKLTNFKIYNYALSDKNGVKKLKVNGSGSHFLLNSDTQQPFIVVKMVTFDSFPPTKNKKVDVAIINVEGAELEVLRGMRRVLSEHEVKIICEVHPIQLCYLGYSLKELEKLLEELGYKIFHISNMGLRKVTNLFRERAHYLFARRIPTSLKKWKK